MHESRKGRQVANCRLFLDDGNPFGVSVITASMHACQIIQSLLPARHKKSKRKEEKKADALNANGKTKQVRKPSYTHGEITVLPEEVATNKVIIQSTLNSEVTNQQKGQLWQDIARKGSNCGVCVRTPDQVREKLSDMKKDFFREREKNEEKKKKKRKNKQRKNSNNKKEKEKNGQLEPSRTNRLTSQVVYFRNPSGGT